MDRRFFEEPELPQPACNLDAGSGSDSGPTGRIMTGIEKVSEKERPDISLVQGDTNTILAGALAAAKCNSRIGHVEAGSNILAGENAEITRRLTDGMLERQHSGKNPFGDGLASEHIIDFIFNRFNTVSMN
jgi:UDP-N-acetylglucosamine 2-epimerase (non-hydrolysing)